MSYRKILTDDSKTFPYYKTAYKAADGKWLCSYKSGLVCDALGTEEKSKVLTFSGTTGTIMSNVIVEGDSGEITTVRAYKTSSITQTVTDTTGEITEILSVKGGLSTASCSFNNTNKTVTAVLYSTTKSDSVQDRLTVTYKVDGVIIRTTI